MSRPTLYLDFDGVLHPGHFQPGEQFCRQGLLVQAITGHELDIVISSSWRFQYPLSKLKSTLHPEIGRRTTGMTGDALIGAHSRWREIERHALFNRISNYRALDDSGYQFPPDCGTLILCDGARGMQPAQADALRAWLSAHKEGNW